MALALILDNDVYPAPNVIFDAPTFIVYIQPSLGYEAILDPLATFPTYVQMEMAFSLQTKDRQHTRPGPFYGNF